MLRGDQWHWKTNMKDYINAKENNFNSTCSVNPEADKLFFQFLLTFCVTLLWILGLLCISFHIHQPFAFLHATIPVDSTNHVKIDKFELYNHVLKHVIHIRNISQQSTVLLRKFHRSI